MPLFSVRTRRGLTLIELLIVTVISGTIASSVFFVLPNETAKMNAHKIEHQIHRMIKNAYDASAILDQADDVKAYLNFAGCSVENMNGAWYLVCNLDELTEGREAEAEIIRSDFAKLHGTSGLAPDSDDQNSVALFLRFSTGKYGLPSDRRVGRADIFQQLSSSL